MGTVWPEIVGILEAASWSEKMRCLEVQDWPVWPWSRCF